MASLGTPAKRNYFVYYDSLMKYYNLYIWRKYGIFKEKIAKMVRLLKKGWRLWDTWELDLGHQPFSMK